MAFITLQDLRGSCEVVVFPDLYKSAGSLLAKDSTIFLKGRVNARDDIPKVLAEEIVPFDEVQKRYTKLVSIDLKTAGLEPNILQEIRQTLDLFKGKTPVYLSFKDPQGKTAVIHSGDNVRVEASDELFLALEKLVGENSVKIR